jgi:hypothetical protein
MTKVPCVARSTRRTCLRTPTATDRLLEPGSPVNRRHARFEALLPPRVRSRGTATLAGVKAPGRCSPGILPLESLLQPSPGYGSSQSSTEARAEPALHEPPEVQPSRLERETRISTLGS